MPPTLAHCVWLSAPEGAVAILGRPGDGNIANRQPAALGRYTVISFC